MEKVTTPGCEQPPEDPKTPVMGWVVAGNQANWHVSCSKGVTAEKHIYITATNWDAECTGAIQLPAGNHQPPVITRECKLGPVKMQFPELSGTCFSANAFCLH